MEIAFSTKCFLLHPIHCKQFFGFGRSLLTNHPVHICYSIRVSHMIQGKACFHFIYLFYHSPFHIGLNWLQLGWIAFGRFRKVANHSRRISISLQFSFCLLVIWKRGRAVSCCILFCRIFYFPQISKLSALHTQQYIQ